MKPGFCKALSGAAFRFGRIFFALFVLCASASALDRNAFTFTAYDLHVRVNPSRQDFSAQGTLTLRNDSATPQRNLALQISSSLGWETVQLAGKPLIYVSQTYESDIDHTGAVTEAVVTLPAEVAPRQSIVLDVSYAGTVVPDATRLTRIGMPEALAFRNDWDRISADFTAMRGVGYVCWYPVAMESVSLSEGNRYFDVLGEWKQRNAIATMKLAVETVGEKGIAANGKFTGTKASAGLGHEEPATRQSDYVFEPIGPYPPSFAVGVFTTLSRPSITVSYVGDHRGAAEEFAAAAERLLPWVTGLLGRQREKVQVIELADPNAVPFDSGHIVFTPLRTADETQLDVTVAHQLAHACEPPGLARLWISEGLAQFTQALARERRSGRKSALDWMSGLLPALQAAEKQAAEPAVPSPQTGAQAQTAGPFGLATRNLPAGQPLTRATDPTYYGIKAMYVWWMLRDIVGDTLLQRAIQSYDPAQDKEPSYMQRLLEAQARRDLEWFFDDWVYRDRGLPDLSIKNAFTRATLDGGAIVTLTVENTGSAAAETPVTVIAGREEATERLLVKAGSSAVVRVRVLQTPVSARANDGSVPEINTENNVYLLPATTQ